MENLVDPFAMSPVESYNTVQTAFFLLNKWISLCIFDVLRILFWTYASYIYFIFRESQSSWFAKRGLSSHVSVTPFKDTEDTRSLTVVHVFDTATQDAVTSIFILKDLFRHVHLMNRDINTLYFRSDNAGCFHSSYSVLSIPELNNKDYFFSMIFPLEEWLFLDP